MKKMQSCVFEELFFLYITIMSAIMLKDRVAFARSFALSCVIYACIALINLMDYWLCRQLEETGGKGKRRAILPVLWTASVAFFYTFFSAFSYLADAPISFRRLVIFSVMLAFMHFLLDGMLARSLGKGKGVVPGKPRPGGIDGEKASDMVASERKAPGSGTWKGENRNGQDDFGFLDPACDDNPGWFEDIEIRDLHLGDF